MLKCYMLIIATFIFFFTEAQINHSKIDKQVNDPLTKENAAKADKHVSKSRTIFDSAMIKKNGKNRPPRHKGRKYHKDALRVPSCLCSLVAN